MRAEVRVGAVRAPADTAPSDDIAGVAQACAAVSAVIEAAVGEYGHDTDRVCRILEARAVGVQRVDTSRIGDITDFLQVAAPREAHRTDLSGHGAQISRGGMIRPDFSRSGLGFTFKHPDAEQYAT